MVNPLKVIIDSNMVDNFSEMNIDPVSAFANSGYTLYITKDVKREIEALINAVDKRLAQSDDAQRQRDYKKRELAVRILSCAPVRSSGKPQRFAGPGVGVRPTGIPVNRTDNDLVRMAKSAWVLTANYKESHWEKAQALPFLVQWFTLKEKLLANGGDLVAALDETYKERS